MKGTLQKFIQDLLYVIFPNVTVETASAVPPCVKYMFDFLDDQVFLAIYILYTSRLFYCSSASFTQIFPKYTILGKGAWL